jgi:membrane protease YdiL (CAAX protease family)
MKKILASIAVTSLLAVPLLVLAQQAPPQNIDLIQVLENVRDWLFTILLIVAVIFIIIAGYNFVTAQGDPEKVRTARNFVLYALVGVAVAVASYALVNFIVEDIMG